MAGTEHFTYMGQLADTIQLAVSASRADSTPAPDGTIAARLLSGVDVWVRIGVGATAAANTSLKLKADMPEYFRARPGERVSVIWVGVDGTIDVTWMT